MMRARLLCGVMLLTCVVSIPTQTEGAPEPQKYGPPTPSPAPVVRDDAKGDPRIAHEQEVVMLKERQQQRYKVMKRDTEKLLELATELEREVQSSDEQTLSLHVMKKAAEIEKLAHSIRNRMNGE